MRRRGADLSTERPSALFLSPEPPYPLEGGGALRSASLLQYLARHFDVDLILFREPAASDPAGAVPPGLVRRTTVIQLPAHSRGSAARGLRNAGRLIRGVPPLVDRFSGFDAQIAAAVDGRRYHIGVIEHFWLAPYWQQIAPVSVLTVLDLHNIESVLHARCAKTEPGAQRVAHGLFAKSALELERHWLPRFSRILTTSEPDAAHVLERAPGARVTVYPNAVPLPQLPSVAREPVVIFSGNLEYHPNISAVRFFREEVWPRLRERWPALIWRLVGKNPEAVVRWTSGDPRIEVRGPVPDAIAELARAQLAVAPILAGSGTRLKILEAWAAGLPVVSTRLGVEGLPAENGYNILLAESGNDFAQAISRILECRELQQKLGSEGRRLVESQFTWDKVWKILDFHRSIEG